MQYGAHLPLIDFTGSGFSLNSLREYAKTADRLGFRALGMNDHIAFPRPWLDGPTALAAMLSDSGSMRLFTTVGLPVLRGPAAFAKTFAALDVLSGGRVVAALGPGSSAKDYALAGIDFEERWKRLDESVAVLRAFWGGEDVEWRGRFYSTQATALDPKPAQRGGIPIWIGSWGTEAGLRRTAKYGDGWLASAYNTTPKVFGEAWTRLREELPRHGNDPNQFPNALSTAFLYITEDPKKREQCLREVVGKAILRPPEELGERLLVGSAEECAGKLAAYEAAGLQMTFVWPVAEELQQLETFFTKVAPMVEKARR
jgi:alkanesulfonate monooxygenase SsuD/methylene tetrahydromethanopterin reductase-like flavin-dependent oxidoreductase (luciferase family)